MKVVYCTVLNAKFAPRAVALHRSVRRHSPDAIFAYYCIDAAAVDLLGSLGLTNCWIVAPDEFESSDLRDRKRTLRLNEYCWTCKPVILQHALNKKEDLDWAVWLDADMFAFGDLNSALSGLSDSNVALTPHRFSSPEFGRLEPIVGRFNAGFVAFRNTGEGRRALDWWLQRCLEGCPASPLDGKYADQKYLDEIPRRFSNVAELASIGVNAAPWNIFDKAVESQNGQVVISGQPLLLYHFQGLRVIRSWIFDLYAAKKALPRLVRRFIYQPYVAALAAEMRAIAWRTHDKETGLDAYVAGMGGPLRAAKHLALSRNLYSTLLK